jgi:phosphoribosylanthranilate isomerase
MKAPRTIVKVCGLTRLEDARMASDAGADWLGFIVHAESPRRIEADRAGEIMASLPGVTGVAVMVGVSPDRALALAVRAGVSRIQVHGGDPAQWPADFPMPAAFAIPVDAEGRLTAEPPAEPYLLMLDTADASKQGGTGRPFPWEAAAALCGQRPVLLAGGLHAENVAAALEYARPFGVDASSRLEASPGIKDPDEVRRFVTTVRHWDRTRTSETP